MTTIIAGNSANKHLADFGSHQKRAARPTTAGGRAPTDIDDSRSELSAMSYATSSNFSSVLKRGGNPNVGSFHHQNLLHELSAPGGLSSSAASQISYEDGFANAEFNAVTEEERAQRRKEEKEQKMKEFIQKTKKNA
jgi:hypothetical protein